MMATNDDMFSSGTNGDSGPTVRKMSPEFRGHARGVLLAEALSDSADHDSEGAQADSATLGRDGFDGAPAPLKRRWIAVAAGLAVAAAGAAIIVGSGVISADDVGLSPADTTTSQDEDINDGANAADSNGNLDLLRTRVTCLSDAGAASDDTSPVTYEHQSEDYTMVAVTYGVPQMCATTSFGGSYTSTRAEGSGEVQQFIRHTTPLDDTYTELLGGKVAGDVTAVDIQSDGDVVASANLENGWFSAFATTQPGAELSYLVTKKDGSSKTVVIDDPLYVSPAEQQGANDDDDLTYVVYTDDGESTTIGSD